MNKNYWNEKHNILCREWVEAKSNPKKQAYIYTKLTPALKLIINNILRRYIYLNDSDIETPMMECLSEAYLKLERYDEDKNKSNGWFSFISNVVKNYAITNFTSFTSKKRGFHMETMNNSIDDEESELMYEVDSRYHNNIETNFNDDLRNKLDEVREFIRESKPNPAKYKRYNQHLKKFNSITSIEERIKRYEFELSNLKPSAVIKIEKLKKSITHQRGRIEKITNFIDEVNAKHQLEIDHKLEFIDTIEKFIDDFESGKLLDLTVYLARNFGNDYSRYSMELFNLKLFNDKVNRSEEYVEYKEEDDYNYMMDDYTPNERYGHKKISIRKALDDKDLKNYFYI